VTGVVIVFAVLSIPLVSNLAGGAISRHYGRFVPPAGDVPAVVVLGAGSRTAIGEEQRMGVLTEVGSSRVLEAARVYRLLGNPWVISSGGTARSDHEASAVAMRRALLHLGVSADRILLEGESLDTYQEAVAVSRMLRQLGASRFALVTTGLHMPRSLAVFRAQGLSPVPAVAPETWASTPWSDLLRPSMTGLERSASAYHELVGLLYYWVRGWI
jgi:uncharacterized SAM-binding protein YcdF (DUF218 family)